MKSDSTKQSHQTPEPPVTRGGSCSNPSHVHRLRTGRAASTWAAPTRDARRPGGIVQDLVRNVFLLEDGLVTVALARRVLGIVRTGSDQDVLKLLQFLDDRVDSKLTQAPRPATFVYAPDAE